MCICAMRNDVSLPCLIAYKGQRRVGAAKSGSRVVASQITTLTDTPDNE